MGSSEPSKKRVSSGKNELMNTGVRIAATGAIVFARGRRKWTVLGGQDANKCTDKRVMHVSKFICSFLRTEQRGVNGQAVIKRFVLWSK
jgi:hypothetical protein